MPGNRVLILVVMEDGLVHTQVNNRLPGENLVLILVVMEDGLVPQVWQIPIWVM